MKILKDLGVLIPASLISSNLHELIEHNHNASHVSKPNDSEALPGSFPPFDGHSFTDSDSGAALLSLTEPRKPIPRTHTLFSCPTVEMCDPSSLVEYIPPVLRKAIQEGKGDCLAQHLILQEHCFSQYKDGTKAFTSFYVESTDHRLHRSWST